ncbi:MAG: DUF2500 domain-containing protein [Clostridia bacterium]|nr:DUF2500 domain-containing protein [Clostridia bacterium]MBQ4085827.1 DUF2500 domain-containing protein [Clostridia bacterium]
MHMGFGFGFGLMETLFPVMFFAVFAFVMIMFAFTIGKAVRQNIKNNRSPRLTVGAKVVSKRQHYRRGTQNTMGHTWYYVTFEVESGDRMELETEGEEYGMLVEGDAGRLSFQGTRFLGFERV